MLTTIKKWENTQGARLPLGIPREGEAKTDKKSTVNISVQDNSSFRENLFQSLRQASTSSGERSTSGC